MKNNRSTGPRSVEGKAVSRMNALKTGIYAQGEVVLRHENAADLELLTSEYYERFAPATPEQRCLVDALISDEWLLRRFRVIEAQQLSRRIREAFEPDGRSPLGQAYEQCDELLVRLQRRVNATRRNYRQTLELLAKLQIPQPKPLPAPPELDQFVPPLVPPRVSSPRPAARNSAAVPPLPPPDLPSAESIPGA